MATNTGKKRGPVSRASLYQAAAAHAHDAIQVLVELMLKGEHEATRMGAAKTLLNKCLPDIKAQELTGRDGEALNGLVLIRSDGDKAFEVADRSTS